MQRRAGRQRLRVSGVGRELDPVAVVIGLPGTVGQLDPVQRDRCRFGQESPERPLVVVSRLGAVDPLHRRLPAPDHVWMIVHVRLGDGKRGHLIGMRMRFDQRPLMTQVVISSSGALEASSARCALEGSEFVVLMSRPDRGDAHPIAPGGSGRLLWQWRVHRAGDRQRSLAGDRGHPQDESILFA